MSIAPSASPEAWLPPSGLPRRRIEQRQFDTVRQRVTEVLAADAEAPEQPLHDFLRHAVARDADEHKELRNEEHLLERVLRTATPGKLHVDPALDPALLERMASILRTFSADERQQLEPLAVTYGRALRAVNGHARRAAQAATADPVEQRTIRHELRRALLQWCHEKLLERLQEFQTTGVTRAQVQATQLMLESRASYFAFLSTLEREFPAHRLALDVRNVPGFDVRVLNAKVPAEQARAVAELVGHGFSQSRVPYFERELASGRLEMIELRQAPELNGVTEPVGCIGVFRVNDDWQVIDWWSRHSGDFRLSSACLNTVARLHPQRRLMYSCNWHSSLPTSRIGGISFAVERGEDPPVAYASSLLLNAEETARCPSKLPEYRSEVLAACATAVTAPDAFVPCRIGGQPHWAIAVSATQEEMRQSVAAIRSGQPFELGRQFFAAIERSAELGDTPPVLTWIEEGRRQTDRVLIFGPNPVDEDVLKQYKHAKQAYGDQLRQIHGGPGSSSGD